MRRYLISAGQTSAGLLAFGCAAVRAAIVSDAGGTPPPGTGVMPNPVLGTPHFANTSKPVEQIRQLVECDGTMYAVGTFSHILQGTRVFGRANVFSFSATRRSR